MKKVISGIDAFLFDMDGTLITSTKAVERCWRAWAQRNKLDVSHVLETIHGRPARDSIKLLAPNANLDEEAAWMLRMELSDDVGVSPIDGAKEFLRSLEGFPWAIVTSADRVLAEYRLKLCQMPLPKILISVDDVSIGKPHPEGYLKAASLLGFSAASCLVLEDTPAGLAAGRAAGAKLIGITTTFSEDVLKTEWTIKDYSKVTFDKKTKTLEF